MSVPETGVDLQAEKQKRRNSQKNYLYYHEYFMIVDSSLKAVVCPVLRCLIIPVLATLQDQSEPSHECPSRDVGK